MDGMRGCMEGTFSLSLLYFFPVLPPPPQADMHVCMMNQTPSPLSRMRGRTVGTVSLLPNSPIVPHPRWP